MTTFYIVLLSIQKLELPASTWDALLDIKQMVDWRFTGCIVNCSHLVSFTFHVIYQLCLYF